MQYIKQLIPNGLNNINLGGHLVARNGVFQHETIQYKKEGYYKPYLQSNGPISKPRGSLGVSVKK